MKPLEHAALLAATKTLRPYLNKLRTSAHSLAVEDVETLIPIIGLMEQLLAAVDETSRRTIRVSKLSFEDCVKRLPEEDQQLVLIKKAERHLKQERAPRTEKQKRDAEHSPLLTYGEWDCSNTEWARQPTVDDIPEIMRQKQLRQPNNLLWRSETKMVQWFRDKGWIS